MPMRNKVLLKVTCTFIASCFFSPLGWTVLTGLRQNLEVRADSLSSL